ncbi:hypothetical protein ACFIJ5_18180 (plasmid) [Haloimpatiens sp. FM7330]|uniref:hypothetical protein n=1 Tax=Haloimpatiens sp. FM7330 TaxID=3298610 RepID=UPI00363CEEF0
MKKFVVDFIVFLIIYFCIFQIGSNTGGNSRLKYTRSIKKDTSHVDLSTIFKDLFWIILSVISYLMYIYGFKDNDIFMIIILLFFVIFFTVILIKDIKKYKINK